MNFRERQTPLLAYRLVTERSRSTEIIVNKLMAHIYILECVDGSYYTGSTTNLERRLWQHQQGEGANHTAKRLPVKLVYCEYFDRVTDAFYREKQVQGWSRKKKQALIVGDTNLLHMLAECQNATHWLALATLRQVPFDSAQGTQDNARNHPNPTSHPSVP